MIQTQKAFMILCLIGIFFLVIPISSAQVNQTNVTETPIATAISAIISTVTTPTVSPTNIKEAKFRIEPTIKIRPVKDMINKSSDGLIELYMDNPSLNDVELNVDVRISVPTGIHVYGQGFGEAGAAGTVYGTFNVLPGKARTIYITIKAERTGNFLAQFSGLYWPGDSKDAYSPISLTHPFEVSEPSRNPIDPNPSNPQIGDYGNQELPYTWIITVAVILIGIGLILVLGRRPPKTEINIE